MKVGYIRVSAADQNPARQQELMDRLGVEKVFTDKQSGKNTSRTGLQTLLDFAREGDTVYIESFSRLARSTKDLLGLVEFFNNKGVHVISDKEKFDTTTATGKLMLTMMAAIAQFERECLLERQREGIAIAKVKGIYKGRKKIDFPKNWTEVYPRWKTRELKGSEAMEQLGLKRNTFYNLVKQYEERAGK